MSGGNFTVILEVLAFIAAVWFAGRAMRLVNLSPLLGEMLVGMALGPPGLDFIPYNHGHDPHNTEPNVFVLVGEVRSRLRLRGPCGRRPCLFPTWHVLC